LDKITGQTRPGFSAQLTNKLIPRSTVLL